MTAKQFVEVDTKMRLAIACANLAKAMERNPDAVINKATDYEAKWLAYAKKHSVR